MDLILILIFFVFVIGSEIIEDLRFDVVLYVSFPFFRILGFWFVLCYGFDRFLKPIC